MYKRQTQNRWIYRKRTPRQLVDGSLLDKIWRAHIVFWTGPLECFPNEGYILQFSSIDWWDVPEKKAIHFGDPYFVKAIWHAIRSEKEVWRRCICIYTFYRFVKTFIHWTGPSLIINMLSWSRCGYHIKNVNTTTYRYIHINIYLCIRTYIYMYVFTNKI